MNTHDAVTESTVTEPVIAEPETAKPRRKKSTKVIITVLIILFVALLAVGGLLLARHLMGNKEVSAVANETAAVLMFTSETEDTTVGTLYYQAEDGEKIKIAKNVQEDYYTLMPKTQTIYYMDTDETLYMRHPDGINEKLAEKADFYSLWFSEDEKTVIFTATVGEKTNLYIKTFDSEREKISSDAYYTHISADGRKVYYCDEESNFYIWDAETDEEEKIASDVNSFAEDGNAYSYNVYNEKKDKSYTYIKWSNESDAYRTDFVSHVIWIQDGNALLGLMDNYYNEDIEETMGDLFLYYPGEKDGIRIASDVCEYFDVSEDGRMLYYTDADGNFYRRELPEINEKTANKTDKINEALDKKKKERLSINTQYFEISSNGKYALSIDNDNNLYIHSEKTKKTKVGDDVENIYLSDDRLAFVTNDGALYANNTFTTSKNVQDENVLIAKNVKMTSWAYRGQAIFYTLENDEIMLLKKDLDTIEFMKDPSEFDKVVHSHGYYRCYLYENVLSMEDIAGFYYIEYEECLLNISEDGMVKYYYIGEPNYATVGIDYSINKYSSSLVFNEDNYYTFTINNVGQKILESDDNRYFLKSISEEEFNAEIAKQIKAEEERIAEEKRQEEIRKKREALEEKGREYYRNDYYVNTTDTLYSSPDAGSATSIKCETAGIKTVYKYEVSEDGEELWLRIYAYGNNGYGSYYWVLAD